MQARSAFYSFGGMIPPMLAAGGVKVPLMSCGLLCLSTVVGGSYDALVSIVYAYFDIKASDCNPSESTHLIRANVRCYTSSPCASENLNSVATGCGKMGPNETQLGSEELALLETIIDAQYIGIDQKNNCPPIVDNLVTTILDATPYCKITNEERNDPTFEPHINKTFSYASPKVVSTINMPNSINLSPGQITFLEDIRYSIALVPRTTRILLALMALLFYSCMTSFVGWLPSYFKLKVFPGNSDWTQMGTEMVSTFFLFMFAGCLSSIPCSVYISITKMIRFHLSLLSCGGILLQLAVIAGPEPIRSVLLVSAACMGYGISAIFPLVVTVSNDYGFTM